MTFRSALILMSIGALLNGYAQAADAPPKTEESIRLENTGSVGIKYLLADDGSVADCQVVTSSGLPPLDDRACEMVRKTWKFKSILKDGKPVPAWVPATVQFTVK